MNAKILKLTLMFFILVSLFANTVTVNAEVDESEYFLYMVNAKGFIFKNRFSIVNDEIVINSTSIYKFSEDYEEEIWNSASGSLGTFTYPTTLTLGDKNYPVTTIETFYFDGEVDQKGRVSLGSIYVD